MSPWLSSASPARLRGPDAALNPAVREKFPLRLPALESFSHRLELLLVPCGVETGFDGPDRVDSQAFQREIMRKIVALG